MSYNIIARIAEGIGNQLFMFANAYYLSRKFGYNLFLDNTSGYFKKKNQIRSFELDKFNINCSIASKNFKFDTYPLDIKRKFLKSLDLFKNKKKIYVEKRDSNKNTFFNPIDVNNLTKTFYIEGHFECERYFDEFRSDLIKLIKVKDDYLNINNPYINDLINSNSVSICIRQNRYSEGRLKNDDKSLKLTNDTIDYIFRSIEYFKKKVNKPKFFIWSNDFKNLKEYFNDEDFMFINNSNNKALNDFYLFSYCKHFIVGPTSFHWWGAWLNNSPNKICIRPSNINPSKNKDFWPESWIKI